MKVCVINFNILTCSHTSGIEEFSIFHFELAIKKPAKLRAQLAKKQRSQYMRCFFNGRSHSKFKSLITVDGQITLNDLANSPNIFLLNDYLLINACMSH